MLLGCSSTHTHNRPRCWHACSISIYFQNNIKKLSASFFCFVVSFRRNIFFCFTFFCIMVFCSGISWGIINHHPQHSGLVVRQCWACRCSLDLTNALVIFLIDVVLLLSFLCLRLSYIMCWLDPLRCWLRIDFYFNLAVSFLFPPRNKMQTKKKDRVRVLKHDGIDYVKRNAAQGSNRVRQN